MLAESQDMSPVQGMVEVDIPLKILWAAFIHANLWPRWNKCLFWVHNRDVMTVSILLCQAIRIRTKMASAPPTPQPSHSSENGRDPTVKHTSILNHTDSKITALVQQLGQSRPTPREFACLAHAHLADVMRPVYSIAETQSVSDLLRLNQGSCSQRMALSGGPVPWL